MAVYALKTMQFGKELSDNPRVWAAEGFDRSGVTGWLFDANNLVETVSRGVVGVNAVTGGEKLSRFRNRNFAGSLFGPTFGAAQDVAQVAGATFTGEFRRSDLRATRRLLPYQNLFYLRNLLDLAVDGIGETLGVQGRQLTRPLRGLFYGGNRCQS